PDTRGVLRFIQESATHSNAAIRGALPRDTEVIVTRAPGRLDVMGGIADYSGSLVLELPIREATHVALARTTEPVVSVVSASTRRNVREFSMSTTELDALVRADDYAEAMAYFRRERAKAWAGYIVGTLVVLARELGVRFDSGLRMLVIS